MASYMRRLDLARYRPEDVVGEITRDNIPPAPKLGRQRLHLEQAKVRELLVACPNLEFGAQSPQGAACSENDVEGILDRIFDVCCTKIADINSCDTLRRMVFLVEIILQDLQCMYPWMQADNEFRLAVETFHRGIQSLVVQFRTSGYTTTERDGST